LKNKENGWTDKQKREKAKVDVSVVTERGFVTCLLNGLRSGQTTTKFFSEVKKNGESILDRIPHHHFRIFIDKVPVATYPEACMGPQKC
jgi:hypothetical protein